MTVRRSSVTEHRFGSSAPYTLGLEEEYMLLDPGSGDLVQRVGPMLEAGRADGLAPHLSPEIFQSELEVHTPVCADVAEVEVELGRLRGRVLEAASEQGLALASAGTHPFSLFERQLVSPYARYLELVEDLRYVVRRELIFGLHVHVALPDPGTAIAVMRGLLLHLPELVALSASSPFWRGQDTGFAATRHLVFAAFPRAGVPPAFRDYAEFDAVVGALEAGGSLADYTRIWWDVRPHPRLGTLEVRAMDAVSRLDDAIALAAYVQALVRLLAERHADGDPLEAPHAELVRENKWRAARYGLRATVLDLAGRQRPEPVRRLVRRTLRALEPHAAALGSAEALAGVRRILAEGNGADRQRRAFAAAGRIGDVVAQLVEETAQPGRRATQTESSPPA